MAIGIIETAIKSSSCYAPSNSSYIAIVMRAYVIYRVNVGQLWGLSLTLSGKNYEILNFHLDQCREDWPIGSTSKSATVSAHAVLLLVVASDPHLWTFNLLRENTLFFFSGSVWSSCLFPDYSFGCSLSCMTLLSLCCLYTGARMWVFCYFVGFFHFTWCHVVEKIRIEMHSWADRIKCVSFFWRLYNSYSQLHIKGEHPYICLSFLFVCKEEPNNLRPQLTNSYVKQSCFVFHNYV